MLRDATPSLVAKAIRSLGLSDRLSGARIIGIKPNLCAGSRCEPSSGVVTNPAILECVVEALRSENPHAQIVIMESDSVGGGYADLKFAFQGYNKLESKHRNVHTLNLSTTPIIPVPYRGLYFKESVVISNIFPQLDFFVSLGKMKTHAITLISGILKNQFGCLPDRDKNRYHPFLARVIPDVNRVITPDLCILEGMPALVGNGPVHGIPRALGVILLSNDPVAIDATLARIVGVEPSRVAHLKNAWKIGLGSLDVRVETPFGTEADVSCIGPLPMPSCQVRFFTTVGLWIQRLGYHISELGHQVHGISSASDLAAKLVRKIRRLLVAR